MPSIYYLPDDKFVTVDGGMTILQGSCLGKIPHASACGGKGLCSTCRVMVLEGLEFSSPLNEKEDIIAKRLHFSPDIRLACQTKITGDVKVRRLVIDDEDRILASQFKCGLHAAPVGEVKMAAIMFADLRGFTAFAETMIPYDIVHTLNRYFYDMEKIIGQYGGYIDNTMGDGFLALFGLDDVPDAAYRAVEAAIDMQAAMARLKTYLNKLYNKCLEIGIGIHYGELIVGTIGLEEKKKKMIIGDAVNLASRIQDANKKAGTRLLVSREVYDQVKGRLKTGRQIHLDIRGKTGEYTLYEILRDDAENRKEFIETAGKKDES